MKGLGCFLEGQRSGIFDPSGEFTVAADKALEKLAHSQLPDPSYWILKIPGGLATVNPLGDRGLDHLVTRPRALGDVKGRRFVLVLRDIESWEALVWDGDKLGVHHQEESSEGYSLALEVTDSTPGAWGALVDRWPHNSEQRQLGS